MKVFLKIQTNSLVCEITLSSGESITIGRNDKSSFKVADSLMSGSHLKLNLTPPVLQVQDLGSKNGTFLNGLRIENSEMYIGDEIKAGTTKITVLAEKMDPSSIRSLTFAGNPKDRIAHELKLDYDNSHHMAQLSKKAPDPAKLTAMEKSFGIKTKNQKNGPLSKNEIKLKHKSKASLSAVIDKIALGSVIALPLFLTNVLYFINPQMMKSNRLFFITLSEIICIAVFYYINFKLMKFTIGEKLSGIEDIYNSQD